VRLYRNKVYNHKAWKRHIVERVILGTPHIIPKAANWSPLLFLYSVHFKLCGDSRFELPQILLGKVGDNLQIVGAKENL